MVSALCNVTLFFVHPLTDQFDIVPFTSVSYTSIRCLVLHKVILIVLFIETFKVYIDNDGTSKHRLTPFNAYCLT